MNKQEGNHQEVVAKEEEEIEEEIHQGEEVETTFIEVQVWKKILKSIEFVKGESSREGLLVLRETTML